MAQYKAAGLSSNSQFMQAFGDAVSEDDTVTIGAALQIGDTVDLIRVAGGTRLQEMLMFNGDCDTAATLQYSLGYRSANSDGVLVAAPAAFGSALTTLQAAVLASAPTRVALAPMDFNEDAIIFATVTAAATGQTGTPTITTLIRGKARGIK